MSIRDWALALWYSADANLFSDRASLALTRLS